MNKGSLLTSLVILSAIAGGSFAYGWNSMNHSSLPNRDFEQAAPASLPAPASPDASPVQSPSSVTPEQPVHETIPDLGHLSTHLTPNGDGTVTLNEEQFTQLINDAIFRHEQAAQLLANADSIQTRFKRDRIETGTVMNLSEVPLEGLPTELQTGIIQLKETVPVLANRDIYIGIVAKPAET